MMQSCHLELQSVNKHYQERRAISGPNHEIEFEKDKVSLDIPITGKTVTGGWTIVPLFHPTVRIECVGIAIWVLKCVRLLCVCMLLLS